MADDKNDDQPPADGVKTQGVSGSRFAVPASIKLDDLPAPNEGENEFYYRSRKMVEDYLERKSARPPEESEGKFLPNVKEALLDVKSIINSVPGPEQPEVETKGATTKNLKKNTPPP